MIWNEHSLFIASEGMLSQSITDGHNYMMVAVYDDVNGEFIGLDLGILQEGVKVYGESEQVNTSTTLD